MTWGPSKEMSGSLGKQSVPSLRALTLTFEQSSYARYSRNFGLASLGRIL